jgi:hypothetical protein
MMLRTMIFGLKKKAWSPGHHQVLFAPWSNRTATTTNNENARSWGGIAKLCLVVVLLGKKNKATTSNNDDHAAPDQHGGINGYLIIFWPFIAWRFRTQQSIKSWRFYGTHSPTMKIANCFLQNKFWQRKMCLAGGAPNQASLRRLSKPSCHATF